MAKGLHNLITDVPGIRVGNAHDERVRSGVSVVLPTAPCIAAVDIRGGAPGTRETDLLGLEQTIEHIHGVVLAGGSAFGLEAAAGVQMWLAARGRGFSIGEACVPLVPAAILFDLLNGGDKNWGKTPPYRTLGVKAARAAAKQFSIGSAGAGYGATTARLKGGLGSASAQVAGGYRVGALVAVNAVGSPTVGETAHFWAAPFECDGEFGGLGSPPQYSPSHTEMRLKGYHGARTGTNTTIAVVATDALLGKAQSKRLAVMAQDGLARAIYPAHTPMDGDAVFALATGRQPLGDPVQDLVAIGSGAANCLARAIARGVFSAAELPGDVLPAYSVRFTRA